MRHRQGVSYNLAFVSLSLEFVSSDLVFVSSSLRTGGTRFECYELASSRSSGCTRDACGEDLMGSSGLCKGYSSSSACMMSLLSEIVRPCTGTATVREEKE